MNSLINELLEKFEKLTEEERNKMIYNNYPLYDAMERIERDCKYYQQVKKDQLKSLLNMY